MQRPYGKGCVASTHMGEASEPQQEEARGSRGTRGLQVRGGCWGRGQVCQGSWFECSLESAGECWKQLDQRARPAFTPDLLTHGRSYWPELRRQFPRDLAWTGHCQGSEEVSQARWSWSRRKKLGVPRLGGHQL